MEKDSPSKPSVAELAGRLKGHILPTPPSSDEFRRRAPRSLKLQRRRDDEEEEEEESDATVVSSNPFRVKMKSSPVIEKLQANLALSPAALLPPPKSPETKLQPAPPPPPAAPRSPPSPAPPPGEEEDPVSFDSPPEGAPLPSINKTRARLSFKRRPPTRRHRRSAGEESPPEPHGPTENGDRVFEEAEPERPDGGDCEETGDEVAKSDRGREGGPEEEEGRGDAPRPEVLEEEPSEPCPEVDREDNAGAGGGRAETPEL